jgi:hypothetical protein
MFDPFLGSLLVGLSLATEAAPACFTFSDAAVHDGRSALSFRTVELGDSPVRPLQLTFPADAETRYGLLLVGSQLDTALAVVWQPQAADGPLLWVDADGDGRLAADERHVLTRNQLEITAAISVQVNQDLRRLRRTLLVRRSTLGDGLRYAVRGFAHGTLRLGGTPYPAMLTDGNADGCFHTAGTDRLWIDLNRDGHFDGFTEQFVLGSLIPVGGRAYTVRATPTAAEVWAAPRAATRGAVRLTLTGAEGRPVTDFAAELVSEHGELVPVRGIGQPVTVPTGRYRVAAAQFQLTDSAGRAWSYRLGGSGPYNLVVRRDQETVVDLAEGAALSVDVPAPPGGVPPGRELAVTPHLRTPLGLYLADCTVKEADAVQATPCKAEIRLLGPDGVVADRSHSGFL